jgi:dephospho-CoA kinase
MFEGIGNIEEEDLIIPDLNANSKLWNSRKVIGVSGCIGSGKSTVAKYLEEKGYISCRFSQIPENMLKERNEEICRSDLQEIGNEIHNSQGQRWLAKKLIEKIQHDKNIVIDGLRFPEDHALMVETFGPSFMHLHIDTPFKLLDPRIKDREIEDIPLNKSIKNPIEFMVNDLKKLSSHIISNDEDLPHLYEQVDKTLAV